MSRAGGRLLPVTATGEGCHAGCVCNWLAAAASVCHEEEQDSCKPLRSTSSRHDAVCCGLPQ